MHTHTHAYLHTLTHTHTHTHTTQAAQSIAAERSGCGVVSTCSRQSSATLRSCTHTCWSSTRRTLARCATRARLPSCGGVSLQCSAVHWSPRAGPRIRTPVHRSVAMRGAFICYSGPSWCCGAMPCNIQHASICTTACPASCNTHRIARHTRTYNCTHTTPLGGSRRAHLPRRSERIGKVFHRSVGTAAAGARCVCAH